MFRVRSFLIILFSALLLAGCQSDFRDEVSNPSDYQFYIESYTTHLYSEKQEIKIRFVAPVAEPDELLGEVSRVLFSTFPKREGKLRWEDNRTLLFTPVIPFSSGKKVFCKVDLASIFPNIPDKLSAFVFSLETAGLSYRPEITGFYALEEENAFELRGTLTFSQAVKKSTAESILKVSIDGETIPITIHGGADSGIFHFNSDPVRRTRENRKMTIKWNGKDEGINVNGEEVWTLPPSNEFSLIATKVNANPDNQFLTLVFSDPIDSKVMPDGLINIIEYDGKLLFERENHLLHVYPQSRLSGAFTLSLGEGLKREDGTILSGSLTRQILFEDPRPAVRLTGREVIAHADAEPLFPFEAIGLHSVEVEIQKIYQHNLLQFLQINRFDGDMDLGRVGTLITRQRVMLNQLEDKKSFADWNRYAIDLSQFIKTDPGAMYQVSIGFSPECVAFPCTALSDNFGLNSNPDGLSKTINAESKSMWDDYFGVAGYYEGYDWNQREDPCYPAYYNYEHFVRKNIYFSSIGLIAKREPAGELLIVATDLSTALPLSNTDISLFSYQQNLLETKKTNSEGIVRFLAENVPAFVVAERNKERAYLKISDGESISLSSFDAGGVLPVDGLKGYFYAERDVWRPGDSIFLNLVLEDGLGVMPDNYPVRFSLYDPSGRLLKERVVFNPVGTIYPFYFNTLPSDPTGMWRVTAKSGGATFFQSVQIETIKPNRVAIQLTIDKEAREEGSVPVKGFIKANWLFGPPAAGLKTKTILNITNQTTRFSTAPDYSFVNPMRNPEFQPQTIVDKPLDNKGEVNFDVPLNFPSPPPAMLNLNFKTIVIETNGEFSQHYTSVPYHPFSSYVGLRLPKDKEGIHRIDLEGGGLVSLISLDKNGQSSPDEVLDYTVSKADWQWWWDDGGRGVHHFLHDGYLEIVENGQLKTNQIGKVDLPLKVGEWGRYFVEVCNRESGHCAGGYFYAGNPWYGDGSTNQKTAASILQLSAEKGTYRTGEDVHLQIPSPAPARLLLSLETGDEIISTSWHEIEKGENVITFTANAEMVPTVYAYVTLLYSQKDLLEGLPCRMYGLIPIEVLPGSSNLFPLIDVPDTAKPGKDITVSVQEKEGRSMAYTLALVDEGLLNITGFKTPDPLQAFFKKEALGVKTWDLFDAVIGQQATGLSGVLSVGGDGSSKKNLNTDFSDRFSPLVIHKGPFFLSAGEQAIHPIKIPDYDGKLRLMVVGAGEAGYGAVEKQLTVKRNLILEASLPPFLGPGEEIELPVTVFSLQKKMQDLRIELLVDGELIQTTTEEKLRVSLQAEKEKTVKFLIKAAQKAGKGRITIIAHSKEETVEKTLHIDILNRNPIQTDSKDFVIEPGESVQNKLILNGIDGTNELELEVSAMPPVNLGLHLRSLLDMHYSCIDCIISSAFPLLYVKNLTVITDEAEEKFTNRIISVIEKLKKLQLSSGGFPSWPGNRNSDSHLTSYAGHFLLEAQANGFHIEPQLLQKWLEHQKKSVKFWKLVPDELETVQYDLEQAYRLFTLALAQQPDFSAMNRLRENPDLSMQARWRLAAAYALAGQIPAARKLVEEVSFAADQADKTAAYQQWGLAEQAIILESMHLLGEEERGVPIMMEISKILGESDWLPSEEIAYSLYTLAKFSAFQRTSGGFNFLLQWEGGTPQIEKDKQLIFRKTFSSPDSLNGKKLTLQNTGDNRLFVRWVQRGVPSNKSEGSNKDLEMRIKYYDQKGNSLQVSRLPLGTEFVAEVSILNPGTRAIGYKNLVLEQIFPVGWTILADRLQKRNSADENNSLFQYRDSRDDRIYTYFDLEAGEQKQFRLTLQATAAGRFFHPSVQCSLKDDPRVYARLEGRWVEVVAGD